MMGTGLRRQRKRVVGRAACPHPATHTLHSEGRSATTVNLQLIENVKDSRITQAIDSHSKMCPLPREQRFRRVHAAET